MKDAIERHQKPVIETLESLILMSASGFSDGEAGDDVLIAWTCGEQLDGGDGQDTLIALVGNNVLNAGNGDDELVSARGNNVLNGGAGLDTAVYWANRDEFTIRQVGNGSLEISDGHRTDMLCDVEILRFDDDEVRVSEIIGNVPQAYRTVDGSGNNLIDPDLGSTNEQLLRLTSTEYSDGAATPAGADRPSAREISNELVAQETSEPNDRQLTDMAWLWGQFIDHDIDLTEAAEPHESFNIPVPQGDPDFDPAATGEAEIDLHRSVYDPETGDSVESPRQQINQITAFIDGSMIYGSDQVRADTLRTFEGGLLQTSENDLLPFNEQGLPNAGPGGSQLFLAGDVRANENVALTAMHTLWMREHNRIATDLAAADPSLSDEELYQRARETVIAEIQAITYNDFLPMLLGADSIPDYTGYDPHVKPSIANEFSTAAYRMGHTMLSAELLRLNNDGTVIDAGNLALQDGFFAPSEITSEGIDSLLKGVAAHQASEVDPMIVDDVRNFLFGPPGAGGFDLASLNIQRGRDHGLPDYNQVREELGLAPVTEFSEITADLTLQQKLENVYGSVDSIDLWVGGLAEDHVAGSSLGATFHAILTNQFTRLRDGDRFWYQNIFSGEKLEAFESVTLSDVIERNTTVEGLPDNVFLLNNETASV